MPKLVSGVQQIENQRKFWNDVCREFGPRGYNSLASRRLGSWAGSHYNKCLDIVQETPRTPKELAEIRTRQRKSELENKWRSITGS